MNNTGTHSGTASHNIASILKYLNKTKKSSKKAMIEELEMLLELIGDNNETTMVLPTEEKKPEKPSNASGEEEVEIMTPTILEEDKPSPTPSKQVKRLIRDYKEGRFESDVSVANRVSMIPSLPKFTPDSLKVWAITGNRADLKEKHNE